MPFTQQTAVHQEASQTVIVDVEDETFPPEDPVVKPNVNRVEKPDKEEKQETNAENTKPHSGASENTSKPESTKTDKNEEETAGNNKPTDKPTTKPTDQPASEQTAGPANKPTTAPENQTPAHTEAPAETYVPSAIEPTPVPHAHNWAERTRTVHHDAVTEEVKVVDAAAYNEPVFTDVPVYEQIAAYICNVCGDEFESEYEHSMSHIDWETYTNPFSYHVEFRQGAQIGTEQRQTGSITHPEKSHMETKVIKAAYDEVVPIGYVCTGCGATK